MKYVLDYYPFGMEMPGRSYAAIQYRFGFSGYEADDEITGSRSHYTTQFREIDTRLGGRWWSTDRVVKPWESPYAGFANNPIWFADPDGRDTIVTPHGEKWNVGSGYTTGNDGQILYGNGLKTKVWDPEAAGPAGSEFQGNYVDYDPEKHSEIITTSESATDIIVNALSWSDRTILQGPIVAELNADEDFERFEMEAVWNALQYGIQNDLFLEESYSYDYVDLVGFGGSKIEAAFDNLTWVVRNVDVNAHVEVSADGVMNITYSFQDQLDLESDWENRSTAYNLIVDYLSARWPGNEEMYVNAAWRSRWRAVKRH